MISEAAVATTAAEFVTFGPVHLDVVDRSRSLHWWQDVVGLRPLSSRDDQAALGVNGEPLVVLHSGATSPVRRGYSGLYHLALLVPDEPALARVLARVLEARSLIGATDHIVAKSLYLSDHDGIGLEIALETPERLKTSRWHGTEHEIVDAEGNRYGGAGIPLDVEQVLATLPDSDLAQPLPTATKVGHVHLAVSDFDASYRFYRDKLGFLQGEYVPMVGFGDLSAGGRVTHRIALNTWQGTGVPPRPREMAGLDHFTLRFDAPERLRDALSRLDDLQRRGGELWARDPDGNAILLELQ